MDNLLTSPFIQNLPYWKNQSLPEKTHKFTDPLFPPNINSLLSKNQYGEFVDIKHGPKMEKRIKIEEITWMRASDIFKNLKYSLFESSIENVNISQGSLGDCYFLASIASLIQYPKLIYQIFKTKNIKEEGYFELIFFIDGKFQIVIVDDYLPIYTKNERICFSKPNNNEIWICILEKAWAKINGGYSNIIKGWMRHVLQAITGFSSEVFKHKKIKHEILWNKIVESKKNNFIITCSTRDNVDIYGLVNNHAYSLVDCIEILSKGKKVKLVLIRNIWKIKEWNGDWGNKSLLWGEEERKQINYYENKKGAFFMSFKDYYNCFDLTEICYVLHNSYSKSYYIKDKNIINGNIFNIYLEEDGFFSISLIRKMWRFNRELINCIIPSYLCIINYNPLNENMVNYFYNYSAKNESYEDISLFKFLQKGYYLIYTLHDLSYSTLKKEDYYIVKFDSPIIFKHKLMPNDYKEKGFILLKNIVIQTILGKNKNNDLYLSIGNNINEYSLGYKMVYNNKNKWLNYKEDISELKNIFILSSYLKHNDDNIFEWFIPPKEYNIILFICIDTKLPYNFILKSKVLILDKPPKSIKENDKINIKEYANDLVNKEYQKNISNYYDYITISLDESKQDLSQNPIYLTKNIKNNIESMYPKIMKLLDNFPNKENDPELIWTIIDNKNVEYIGQINKFKKKEGKGCLIYKNSDHALMGIFKEGKINGYGIVYNKALENKIFEGNYCSGKKNGKGVLYLYNGDRYEGEFENDKRTGKGIYYFNSEIGEQSWEGNFLDGNMEGEGVFTNHKGEITKVKYCKGKQVK